MITKRTRDILVSSERSNDSGTVCEFGTRVTIGWEQALEEGDGRAHNGRAFSTVVSANEKLPRVNDVGVERDDFVGSTRCEVLRAQKSTEL